MTTMTETLKRPDGSVLVGVGVTVLVAGEDGKPLPAAYASDGTKVSQVRTKTGSTGAWSIDVPANDDLTPAGTVYRITMSGEGVDQSPRFVTVPDSGPVDVADILTDAPGAIASSALSAHEAATTNVHGIADTSALLDSGDIGSTVQAHSDDLDDLAAGTVPTDIETALDARYASRYVVTDEASFAAAIAASVADGSHHKIIEINASLLTVSESIVLGESGSYDFWEIVGQGYAATNIRGTVDGFDIFDCRGREIHFRNLTISSATARASGSTGHGIRASNPGSTTQSRIVLDGVRVMSQPEHGIYATDPEMHHYVNSDFVDNGGDGIRWDQESVVSWNNATVSCRATGNDGVGLYCPEGSHYDTHINFQAYSNLGGYQVDIAGGRGCRFINGDFENVAVGASSVATSGVGVRLRGVGHAIVGGHLAALETGVVLTNASRCRVGEIYATNESASGNMTAAVEVEATCTNCEVDIASSYPDVTTVVDDNGTSTVIITDGARPDAVQDTGRRDVRSLLTTGWTADVFEVRRIGDEVELSFRNLDYSSGGGIGVATLPVGFRPPVEREFIVSSNAGASSAPSLRQMSVRNDGAVFFSTVGDDHHGCIRFFVDSDFPATLPGSAA